MFLVFLDYFNVLVLKKYYFNIFLNKKYFKKTHKYSIFKNTTLVSCGMAS